MAAIEDVARMAQALPEVVEGERYGNLTWFVRGKKLKAFAWERPFSKADIKRFGSASPPAGPIIAVAVADLGEKEAVLAGATAGFFTIPHFDGFAAFLISLDTVTEDALSVAIIDAWLACAPANVADQYLKDRATADREDP